METKLTYVHGLIFTKTETNELLFLKHLGKVLQTEVDFSETRVDAIIRQARLEGLDLESDNIAIEFISVDDMPNSRLTNFFYAIPVDYESLKELVKEEPEFQLHGEKRLGEYYKEIVEQIKNKIEKTKL